MKRAHVITCHDPAAGGFTLVELVVVLAMAGLLVVAVLPALAGTNIHNKAAECLVHQKQLVTAWLMYANDNNGSLPPNADETGQPASLAAAQSGQSAQWCPGRQDLTSQLSAVGTPLGQNVGAEWIECGLIYSYLKNPLVYKCPADAYATSSFGLSFTHARSVSMNTWLAPVSVYTGASPQAYAYYKLSQLVRPGFAGTFVFIDENPLSINDGSFVASPQYPDWINAPAAYHDGGAGMSFADGHAIIRRWSDPAILGARTLWTTFTPSSPAYPNGADLVYLENASSYIP